MSANSSRIKAQFLGMNHGTAQHKLKQLIMLMLIQRTGLDNCFKCGLGIIAANDLSIDHKQPWLYVDSNLFWNLDNIAFSHKRCNRPDRPAYKRAPRNVAPEGQSWCSGHKTYFPSDQFSNDINRPGGKHAYCRECDNTRLTANRTCRICGFYGKPELFRSRTRECKPCFNSRRREYMRAYMQKVRHPN